jgi:hypothetical protein
VRILILSKDICLDEYLGRIKPSAIVVNPPKSPPKVGKFVTVARFYLLSRITEKASNIIGPFGSNSVTRAAFAKTAVVVQNETQQRQHLKVVSYSTS